MGQGLSYEQPQRSLLKLSLQEELRTWVNDLSAQGQVGKTRIGHEGSNNTSLCLLLPVPNLGTGPGKTVKKRQRAAGEARGGFDVKTKVTGVLQVK